MVSNKKKIQDLLEKAISNAQDDRDKASSLLKDVSVYIGLGNLNQNGSDRHREVGLQAAKYIEVLAKSNEQIIKIAELFKKTMKEENAEMTDEDKSEFYKELEGEEAEKDQIKEK